VLEGELMVAGPDGRADPDRLQERARVRSEAALRRLAERSPVTFLAADLLWLEGHSAQVLPYRQRRRLLDQLGLEGPAWRTVPSPSVTRWPSGASSNRSR
jgi:bifunctional non-homologous end joining protein LigD